jgi:NAD-dependent dihydropyrimidine dehydrogenase PreA subunit
MFSERQYTVVGLCANHVFKATHFERDVLYIKESSCGLCDLNKRDRAIEALNLVYKEGYHYGEEPSVAANIGHPMFFGNVSRNIIKLKTLLGRAVCRIDAYYL